MIAAIINNFLSHQEKDGMIACFVFAAYAKHKAEKGATNNLDIIKVLPLRYEDEKLKIMLYDEDL